MVEMIIDDQHSIDIDKSILDHARKIVDRANEGDDFASDALCCILFLMAMFVARAKHGEDTEAVEKFARFFKDCAIPVAH